MLDKIFRSGLPEVPEPEAQKLFDREQTARITITTSRGTVDVTIGAFSAMTGWSIEQHAKDYYSADDSTRQAFTNAVLSHASIGDKPLDSDAARNELLERWQNVRAVFEGVLEHNGIDLNLHYVMRDDLAAMCANIGKSIVMYQDAVMTPLIESLKKGETPQ
ncbi:MULTISPECIES: hypothetical protein [unclassified Caballeronia]|uniref:hypothetical protein n=1 Tax=unclassified Caballeronia TaxID=2646786 RepID=UPI002861684B|nr:MULTISPECIES: hypothetical protein [unclassified Caballeronia]MDR5751130.1 hypothetical protein [Caballeronia sp. LZ024]MDR5844733.1 hypothetical protein [Caballeronia sp. LZ031]